MPLTKAVSKPSILSPVAKESLAVKPLKSPLRKSISDGTASHRPVASTSKLNAQAIADQLVDKLFASVLGAKVQEIAVDALTGAEEQDRQRMVAERADFIDDMANNLVDQALDERIRLVACKTYLERRLLSRYLEVWRQMFEERQEREAYQKERVGLLRTAATGLGAGGPSTVSPTYTEDHLDLNRLKITAASGSTDEQNIELLNTVSNLFIFCSSIHRSLFARPPKQRILFGRKEPSPNLCAPCRKVSSLRYLQSIRGNGISKVFFLVSTRRALPGYAVSLASTPTRRSSKS